MKVELTDQELFVILKCIEIADHESFYKLDHDFFPDGSDPSFTERIQILIGLMEKLQYNEQDINSIRNYIE